MFQTIHAHLLPRVDSYAKANSVYDKAPTFKNNNWRALKDKRDMTKLLRREGESIVFMYHDTVLVEWDRTQIRLRSWDSQSSAAFANQFLPIGIHARTVRGKMYYSQNGKYYEPNANPLVFNQVDGKWVVDESTVMRYKTKTLNRKKAAGVRKIMKPFMDWLAITQRMGRGTGYDRDTRAPILAVRQALLAGHVNEADYPKLAEHLYFHKEHVWRDFYILGGAVEESLAPIGSTLKPSIYDHRTAWSYL